MDGDAGLHQPIAERVNVVDLVGEVTEIARLAIVLLRPPIICQLDQGRGAVLRSLGYQPVVAGSGEEDQRELGLVIDDPAHFRQAELVAIEIERRIEIAHAQHCVQIPHNAPLGVGCDYVCENLVALLI